MKIISIKQPWASLIVSGAKDVENRTWLTTYRGPILVHASQRSDPISGDEIQKRFGVRPPVLRPEGGVIGITEIIDCVRRSDSTWHMRGHWGFVLTNSRPLVFVACKGQLGIRDVPPALLAKIKL